ncbi:MAG: Rnf-Nqr domain containing protein [Clostridiales bacterium]
MGELKTVIYRNLWKENPVIGQILGICSSLAVTNLLVNTLVMSIGVTFTLTLSAFVISLLRNLIPQRIRMMVYTLIIAVFVILVDIVLRAKFPDISKALGPYIGLIITNCILMGRMEAFAQKNKPSLAMLDGFFSGLGYSIILMTIAFVREFLGFGTIFGIELGLNFEKWTIMVTPAAAFFLLAILIWIGNNRMAAREIKSKEEVAK